MPKRVKEIRPSLHTTVDPALFTAIKMLAVKKGTKYGKLIEEGMKMVLEKYGELESPNNTN